MLAEIATMGTVITLTVDDDSQLLAIWNDLVNEVTHELERIDDTFSTYRVNSEVSRFRRGEGVVHSEDFDEVLVLCEVARELTDGYFDPWAVPGGYDPSGLVKGWAGERALALLIDAGANEAIVNAGGDIAIHASNPVNVAIRHPEEADRVCGVVQSTTGVATSGLYERGCHIVNPFGDELSAVAATVVGAPLYLADAFATALIAGGDEVLAEMARQGQFRGCYITPDLIMHAIPGTLVDIDAG